MTTQDFTPEQRKALHKIELLLRKAEGNANEHEASTATQLAQDLLAKYNLSMEALGAGDSAAAERQDIRIPGGFFEFERDLWKAIAELNWCWYFSTMSSGIHKGHGVTRVHRLIGKKVNILSTKLMAEYLLDSINKLAKEFCLERDGTYHNRSAVATSFRKGAAERLVQRLQAKRWEILQEERQREASAPSGTGTGLVMARLSDAEYQRNYDFIYGDGAYAQSQARSAKWREEMKEIEAREKAWRLANPEEAARLDREAEEKQRKEDEKWARAQARRKYRPEASDMEAYRTGSAKARDIGLEKQVADRPATKGRIGG